MDVDRHDRQTIEFALADPTFSNGIAHAAAEQVQRFMKCLYHQAKQNGGWPNELLLYRPETAFDDIVIRLTLQAVADETGHSIDVHWIPNHRRR